MRVRANRRQLSRDFFVHLSSAALLPHRYRGKLLRLGGIEAAKSVHLRSGVRIVGAGEVQLKQNVFLNEGVYMDASASIRIEPWVQVGNHARLITSTHELDTRGPKVAGELVTAPIVIEEGAWIGAGATVLPGVTVGHHAVLGSGAIATRDLEPYGIYVGVPARLLRMIKNSAPQ